MSDKRVQCPHCNNFLKTKHLQINHLKLTCRYTQNKPKPHTCEKCNYATYFSTHLLQHQSVHSNELPYLCHICGKSYKSGLGLKQHITRMHNNGDLQSSAPIAPPQLHGLASSPHEPNDEFIVEVTQEGRSPELEPVSTNESLIRKSSISIKACMLWSPRIFQELQLHKRMNCELFTKSIGKLLSDAVIQENPAMDWKQPFILVDVLNEGYPIVLKLEEDISIPVVEKTANICPGSPVNKRRWHLTLSYSLLKLGLEILRKVPTTIMIWGARMIPSQNISEKTNTDFCGHIHLDTSIDVNIIVFHDELISEEQVKSILENLPSLELRQDDWIPHIVCDEVDEVFAIHVSKNYNNNARGNC